MTSKSWKLRTQQRQEQPLLPCKCLTLLVTFQAIADLSCEDSYDCSLPYKECGAQKLSNGVTQLVSHPVGSLGFPVPDPTEQKQQRARLGHGQVRTDLDKCKGRSRLSKILRILFLMDFFGITLLFLRGYNKMLFMLIADVWGSPVNFAPKVNTLLVSP